MNSFKKTVLVLVSVFLLSGCSFYENNEEGKKNTPPYVELEGTLVDENSGNFSFSKFSLLNASGEKLRIWNRTQKIYQILSILLFL